ncbi:MAG TPA: D-alanyl-D-alanine carboxypeptidase/D-alanyl-D-alanine-endopeptidase [Acidobacteriaceae bacterium]|jgi:dihydroorotase/N-acyl-D-amino-acid deacylase|nr:D-alanyl-D-alanine carboxypeptidase/D-alanyl-D-alanine-endopeptidase [Acidobacteriaceae bacterium]
MMKNKKTILFPFAALAVFLIWPQNMPAQNQNALAQQIHAIAQRPLYQHASFGVEVYSLDEGKVLYSLRGQQLFTPGSTTKLLTEGTALELLGPDYRFHTRVYRTGPITPDGTLHGDLILVASGDPNLSGRIQPDDTLTFENEDHAYGGSPDTKAVPGDPLLVIRQLAAQVAAHGVKRIDGRVLVDVTLFPEGERELGTGLVISPVSVNDNIVDLTVSPGSKAGAVATLHISPESSYATFINHITTGPAGSKLNINPMDDVTNPDGSHTVTLSGTFPLNSPSILYPYAVPEPSRFAQVTFIQALQAKGIQVKIPAPTVKPDFKTLASSYTDGNVVADHVSPPLSQEIKVTLKVSQNLHASTTPYILGAILDSKAKDPEQAGFDLEHKFLAGGDLDLSGASQADGAGGAQSAFFTPDFMVHYLAFMSKQKNFPVFEKALPVLGRDGTLWNIEVNSPAAGHVFAKTGTFGSYDALNKNLMLNGKGLAGYMTTADGRHVAFAIYANRVSLSADDPNAADIVGRALGEIASAIYSTPSGEAAPFDVLIRNGHILDGAGGPWYAADIGIRSDRIAAIGKLDGAQARKVIDATGQIVSPGFIDMLGQSETSLLIDNRSLSKLSQGITTEITGEGGSIAPQDAKTLAALQPFLNQYHLAIDWTTLDGYFRRLKKNGTPINIGTYVGAAQVREAVIGEVDRAPTPAELDQMKALVAQAMKDGAMGLSTALIYPPGSYAKTEELIALAKVAGQYGGIYATHMRSEGATEMEALDEAIRIGREGGLPVEVFHLKVSGKPRWGTMPQIVAKIQAARDSGLDIRADQYPYLAGGTALASSLPPWVADGGMGKMLERLRDPQVRARIKREMATDHKDWENLYFDSGGGSGVLISGVDNPALKKYDGMTVAQMAKAEGKPELDALLDFILADKGQTGALYFIASEKDLTYALKQQWTSICLDANEMSLDGPLFEPHTHPRAWGAFPRFLGYYVRDEHLMPLPEAIRKITSMPAQREHLTDRGLIKKGFYADITIFNPATIIDRATYTHPNQLSQGVDDVFVNGQLEYDHGKLTDAKAGEPLRGPGWHGDSGR